MRALGRDFLLLHWSLSCFYQRRPQVAQKDWEPYWFVPVFCFSSAAGSSACSLSSLALTQVEIIRSFTAKQPDELSLQVADVVLIYQRVSDGECRCSHAWSRVQGVKNPGGCFLLFMCIFHLPLAFLMCTSLSSFYTSWLLHVFEKGCSRVVCYSKGTMTSFPSFPVTYSHLRTVIFPAAPTQSALHPSSAQTHRLSHLLTSEPLTMSFILPCSHPLCSTSLSTSHHLWYPTAFLVGAEHSEKHPDTCCFMRTLFFSAGWYEGERLRDGERGWFPMECAKEITCQATIDKNVERMGRLLGLETNV